MFYTQSAVRSPQSMFYTDRCIFPSLSILNILRHGGLTALHVAVEKFEFLH